MKGKWFGKKQMILALMVAALGLAVYLNYYMAANTPLTTSATEGESTSTTAENDKALGESQFVSTPTSAQTEGYFDAARKSREDARQEALDIIKETLQDVKADEAQTKEAVETAAAVAQAVEQEDAIETLIKAKGFEDCVVYIENGNCHVVVKAETLESNQTLQISEIVSAQSAVERENINIVAVAK